MSNLRDWLTVPRIALKGEQTWGIFPDEIPFATISSQSDYEQGNLFHATFSSHALQGKCQECVSARLDAKTQ